jgi:aromatic ring hydroxylase
MAARTGEQFLHGLASRRDLWVGGDKVSSVVDHPALSGAAQALAEVFDLQHRHADVCLMPDSETGEPINISHMIPRSREDLQRRHRGLECVAEYSVGLMRFYLGSVGRNLTALQANGDRTRVNRLLDRFLSEELETGPRT